MIDSHLTEWLNLLIRWLHITVGVAWIGASFYFNWLENTLNRKGNLKEGIAGNLWAIHGGGFYYLEKYKNSPAKIPEDLHWFKWEAYMTGISGFALLCVVYYFNAKTFLINSNFSEMSEITAILISAGSLIFGWFAYDGLCKSPLKKYPIAFFVVGFLFLCLTAYFYSTVFSSRASYIHLGAFIGTIMVGNVFRNIIPAQKILVSEAKKGKTPDPKYGQAALLRSRHNNYLTLPVLFIMVSNHFPSTYGNSQPWLILMGISLVGICIRHYFNIRRTAPKAKMLLPFIAIGILSLALVTKPRPLKAPKEIGNASPTTPKPPVKFSEVDEIFKQRCRPCHSAAPTDDIFQIAPANLVFDRPNDIRYNVANIKRRVIDFKDMPFNNKTKMTDKERLTLDRWIREGSNTKN